MARLGFLCMVAVAFGFGVNALRAVPLPFRYETPAARLAQATEPGEPGAVTLLSLEEMQALATTPDVLLLDARPEVFYELGHIPGAAHLPKNDFDAAFATLEPHLRQGGFRLLVIYCSGGDCEDSAFVVEKLRTEGIGPLAIFEGGWEVWTQQEEPGR